MFSNRCRQAAIQLSKSRLRYPQREIHLPLPLRQPHPKRTRLADGTWSTGSTRLPRFKAFSNSAPLDEESSKLPPSTLPPTPPSPIAPLENVVEGPKGEDTSPCALIALFVIFTIIWGSLTSVKAVNFVRFWVMYSQDHRESPGGLEKFDVNYMATLEKWTRMRSTKRYRAFLDGLDLCDEDREALERIEDIVFDICFEGLKVEMEMKWKRIPSQKRKLYPSLL